MSFNGRPGVTDANVTATLALFFALGGGAYAAATRPARSVGPQQLKKDAVVRVKIKNKRSERSKVLADSLTGDDVKEASLAKVPSSVLADTATNATHAAAAAALDKVARVGSRSPRPRSRYGDRRRAVHDTTHGRGSAVAGAGGGPACESRGARRPSPLEPGNASR
jgi:hypothetical protein